MKWILLLGLMLSTAAFSQNSSPNHLDRQPITNPTDDQSVRSDSKNKTELIPAGEQMAAEIRSVLTFSKSPGCSNTCTATLLNARSRLLTFNTSNPKEYLQKITVNLSYNIETFQYSIDGAIKIVTKDKETIAAKITNNQFDKYEIYPPSMQIKEMSFSPSSIHQLLEKSRPTIAEIISQSVGQNISKETIQMNTVNCGGGGVLFELTCFITVHADISKTNKAPAN